MLRTTRACASENQGPLLRKSSLHVTLTEEDDTVTRSIAKRRLTKRQEDFCYHYLQNGGNASKAARDAGYHMPYAEGWKLLQIPEVKQRLADLQAPRTQEMKATFERTIQELARVAFSDIRNIFDENGHLRPIKELEPDVAAAIASVEVEVRKEGRGEDAETYFIHKVKQWDKMKALEMLSKHFKVFEETAPSTNVNVLNVSLRDMMAELSDDERTLLRRLLEARSDAAERTIEGTRSA